MASLEYPLLRKSDGCTLCRDSRDPRFDSLSGTLDTDRFRKRYAFLYDEQLPAEREEIKHTLQVRVCKNYKHCKELPLLLNSVSY